MVLSTEPTLLEGRLRDFFRTHDEDVFLFHTDLGACGPLKGVLKRFEYLTIYSEVLFNSSDGRTLLFPLFNYDYSRTRRYNVLEDKCQVGVLNEFIRLQRPERRTWTPLFNFMEWPGETFSLAPCENPFGEVSLWGDLCKRNGRICFLGADYFASTFTHFIEEMANVGYRYLKPMPGVVQWKNKEDKLDFKLRVRPMVEGLIVYDADLPKEELIRKGILESVPFGAGKLLSYTP